MSWIARALDSDDPVASLRAELARSWPKQLDKKDQEGRTPLVELLQEGGDKSCRLDELVRCLLAAGADPSLRGSDDQTPLEVAEEAAEDAAAEEAARCVPLLAAAEAEQRSSARAAELTAADLIAWASDRGGGGGDLIEDSRHLKTGIRILNAGVAADDAPTGTQGKTALMCACEVGSMKKVRLLLSKGADKARAANSDPGHTPLFFAIRGACRSAIELLRDYGAQMFSVHPEEYRRAIVDLQRRGEDVSWLVGQWVKDNPGVPFEFEPAAAAAAATVTEQGGPQGGEARKRAAADSYSPWEQMLECDLIKPSGAGFHCGVCSSAGWMSGQSSAESHVMGKPHHQVVRLLPDGDPRKILSHRAHFGAKQQRTDNSQRSQYMDALSNEQSAFQPHATGIDDGGRDAPHQMQMNGGWGGGRGGGGGVSVAEHERLINRQCDSHLRKARICE